MTNRLNDNQKLFVQAIFDAVSQRRNSPSPQQPPVPAISYEQERAFRGYTPKYWTKVGLVSARFKRTDVSHKTGEPVAFYDLTIIDPDDGNVYRKTVLYGIRGGVIREIKAFDWRRV